MNLDALVRRDHQPWQPCPEATDLDEWHRYDVPLVGTFDVGSASVLFAAMGDASGDVSIWAYAELTSAEAAEVSTRVFDDTEDLQRAVEEYFHGKEAVIGLASGLQLKRWGRVEVTGSLLDATSEFVELLLAEARRQGSAAVTSVRRAQIEAAASELVSL
jgi:hypothetical protein